MSTCISRTKSRSRASPGGLWKGTWWKACILKSYPIFLTLILKLWYPKPYMSCQAGYCTPSHQHIMLRDSGIERSFGILRSQWAVIIFLHYFQPRELSVQIAYHELVKFSLVVLLKDNLSRDSQSWNSQKKQSVSYIQSAYCQTNRESDASSWDNDHVTHYFPRISIFHFGESYSTCEFIKPGKNNRQC